MSADITKPETWYGLKLGETSKISDSFFIRRVPGGWMSIRHYGKEYVNGYPTVLGVIETFIPFNPEFYKNKSRACNNKRYVKRIGAKGGLL